MEILLKDPRLSSVVKVCERLWEKGYEALLAGGCVRDGILGVSPGDYDVATNAHPDQIEALFEKTVSVGKAFGVILVIQDGLEIEVATFRKDLKYKDGRHPEGIEFTTAKEDASRRDFTINALFYDLRQKKVVDYVEGLKDLQARLIRAVGDPTTRFSEDHLRVLRAVRFQSQLGFAIEAKTLKAVHQAAPSVRSVSGERIHQEILKLLKGDDYLSALRLLFETKLLDVLADQSFSHWVEPKDYFEAAGREPEMLWACWFYWLETLSQKTFSKVELEDLCLKFRLSRNQTQFVKRALDLVGRKKELKSKSLGSLLVTTMDPASRFGMLLVKLLSPEVLPESTWLQLSDKEKMFEKAYPPPLLQAQDLPPGFKGVQIGEALRFALEAQLEGSVVSKDQALKWVLEKMGNEP